VAHREPQARRAQRAAGERSSSRPGARAHGAVHDALLLAVVLAAAVAAYRPFLGLGHLGWDTYPLILTSRITSASDLIGAFREELMDGRYPYGHFYRPVTTLSFALDHAVWGLHAYGYHLSDVALLLACTAGVAALGRRLLGPGPGPLLAALVFALHPLHVETVPVAARRADGLAMLFTLLALVAARRAGRRAGLCALCAALSVGAKETGTLVVPLLLALSYAESGPARFRERVRAAVRSSALPMAAVGLVLLARSAVLGGIGGHPESSLLGGAARGLAIAPHYAFLLLMPQPLVSDTGLAWALVAAAAAGLAIGLGWLVEPATLRRLLVVCGTWLLITLWLTGVSGAIASWYAVAFLPAVSLSIGAVAQGAARRAAEHRRAAAFGAVATGLLLVLALRFTPLVHAYPEWPAVSRRSHEFLERVRAAVRDAAPGDVRSVSGIPLGIAAPLERVGVRSALGIAEYSVEAWAELTAPDRRVVVVRSDGRPTSRARPDAIVIETTPDPESSLLP
jgi:hypothetical protein